MQVWQQKPVLKSDPSAFGIPCLYFFATCVIHYFNRPFIKNKLIRLSLQLLLEYEK
jgi:hypothetical protein